MNDTVVALSPPDAASPAPATARDVQRTALADLLALLKRSAESEAAIELEHRQKLDTAAKDLDRAKLQADHYFSTHSQESTREIQQRTADALARYESDNANTIEADRIRRIRVKAELDNVQRDIKKQIDHAVWLADSVSDGTQAKAKQDGRKAREDNSTEHDALDALLQKANEALLRFGHLPIAGAGVEPIQDTQTPPDELYKQRLDATESARAALESLGLPRLVVGFAPWLLGAAVLAGCGVAGKFLLSGRMPDWQALAVGLGGGALVVVIIGVLANVLARRQVRAARAPFEQALASARWASDRKLEETKSRLDAMVQKALTQREVEIRAVRDKFEPMAARATSKHDDAIAALDRELKIKQGHLSDRRDKLLADAQSHYETSTSGLREKIDRDLAAARERSERHLRLIEQQHAEARQQLVDAWHEGLSAIQRNITQRERSGPPPLENWTDAAIESWRPPSEFPSAVRFGSIEVDAEQLLSQLPEGTPFTLDLPRKFDLPAVLALPRQASLLIQADRAGRPAAVATLQMLMARLLTSVPPGRVKFTIIDPVALGQNFAGFMHLADYDESLVASRIWTDPEHIERRLTDLTEHMETVIQKYLRNEFPTIDDYNRQAGELAEPYRFLVISDFPHGFQPDALRRLASIASTGARCGVYTSIFRDTRQPVAAGSGFDDVEAHSVNLMQSGDRFVWNDDVFAQFLLTLDTPPGEEQLTRLMHKVGRLARDANRVEVPFEHIAPKPNELWSLSAKSELRIPIGRMGATRHQALRLGKGVAQHTLIAGKTGSGKSTLLHAIVTNAAMWYSPDEVELYLIDFKKGVEFKTYATNVLPHARAIAVESDREFGLSVLQRIDAEMTRRGEMFRALGVQDLGSYRDAAGKPLPRVLLIIDEFQEFFVEDDKLGQDAALLIDRLVRQGRAFGIHVLLGSQTIGGTSGISRATLGQMAVRIALQCSESDSQLILGDNNSAARLLTRPGEAIYNDAGGLVEGNSPFQVAWLPDETRDRLLQRVIQQCAQLDRASAAPIVFEGNSPADIRKNARLASLLNGAPPPAYPLAYLGEPVAIKDPTAIPFRRQAGTNALLVGQGEEQALAMVASSMISLSAGLKGREASFVLMDGTPADSSWAGRLAEVAGALAHPVKTVDYRSTGDAIAELAAELKRRQESDDTAAAPVFVLIFGLQRYRVLRKSDDGFSFGGDDKPPSPDKQFSELLKEGPSLGIHVIAWADTAVSVDRTIDRNALREFDHRVLMQMSATDSSTLIDSPAANKLGFYRAIAFSEEQGTIEKFRPYALPPMEWLLSLR